MHRQETCGLLNRESTVRACGDLEVRDSGVFFVEKIDITRKCWAGIRQMMRLLTSADQLQVHPLRMQPRCGNEAISFLFFAPFQDAIPTLRKLSNKKPSQRADGLATLTH